MDYLIIRFLSALLTGIIISQAGSLIQMSTRNLLASPSTLGFDGLAILWVLLFHSIVLMLNIDQPLIFQLLLGLPMFFLLGWCYSKFLGRKRNIERLILIGLTFNLLVGAIFSLWQFLFLAFNLPFPVELWFGHFRFSDLNGAMVLLTLEVFFLAGWFLLRKDFIIYSMGRSVARNLKLNTARLYLFMFTTIAIGTFAVVGLFGAFSFLGLIFPIISRKLWFSKYDLSGELLWGSTVNGLAFLLVDSICYFFPIMGAEIPVGLIATAVGAVSLIMLLWKSDSLLEILAKK